MKDNSKLLIAMTFLAGLFLGFILGVVAYGFMSAKQAQAQKEMIQEALQEFMPKGGAPAPSGGQQPGGLPKPPAPPFGR